MSGTLGTHAAFRLLVSGFVLSMLLWAWAGPCFGQTQTPTLPSPSPGLDSLRKQLQKNLSGMKGAEETGEESQSLKDKGKDKDKGKGRLGDEVKEGEATPDGPTPPGARTPDSKTTAPVTRVTIGGAKAGGQAAAGVRIGGAAATGGAVGGGGQGAATAVRMVGEGKYEPYKDRKLEYKEVPDAGEEMTLVGPLTVGEFLDTMSLATNWNVLVTEEAKAVSLEFWITGVKPKDALEILKFHDIYYEYKEDTKYLYVMTKEEYLDDEFGELQEVQLTVENADTEYIESILVSLLSSKGRIIVDPRTQRIYVWDTKDNADKMVATVKELDVPLSDAEFVVKHADVADMESILTSFLSPSGNIITDPRTGHLLVRDLDDSIKRMTDAMAKFDVPLEPRVFALNHVDADDMIDSVESLLTERGMAQVDPRMNTLIVTDLPSRQDQIGELLKVLDQKLETFTWTINYVEPDDIGERIETLVPEEMGDIIVDEDVHQITVTALPDRIKEIDALIKAWDIRRSQVQIEAHLVAVGDTLARSLGVSWSYFDSTGNAPQAYRINSGAAPDYTELTNTITVGQLPYAEPLRNWVTGEVITDINDQEIIKKFHGNRIAATLDYLDSKNKVHVLSSPRVTVQDGEEAVFQNGRQVPYVTSTSYGSGYRNNQQNDNNNNFNYGYYSQPYNRIDFIEVGTILRVLPRITQEDNILLDLIAEDSDAANVTVISNGEENTIPEKRESKAETQVRVADGQTIVIGGLRKGNSSESVTKSLPILSDIPVIGSLFKVPTKKIDNQSLMIFLTITVVDDQTGPESKSLADFDDAFSSKLREAKKSSLDLLFDKVARDKSEIGISIGQSGHMHCDGKRVTIEELREKLGSTKSSAGTKVIIRKHPLAPEKATTELLEVVNEYDLRVDFDGAISPFVPDYDHVDQSRAVQDSAVEPSAVEEAVPASAPEPLSEARVQ